MKRFITALICGILLLFHTQPIEAQTVEKLKLKQVYKQDHLDKIIDAIGKDTDVRGNIDGGYGIFTGISGVVRTITVTKRQGF